MVSFFRIALPFCGAVIWSSLRLDPSAFCAVPEMIGGALAELEVGAGLLGFELELCSIPKASLLNAGLLLSVPDSGPGSITDDVQKWLVRVGK